MLLSSNELRLLLDTLELCGEIVSGQFYPVISAKELRDIMKTLIKLQIPVRIRTECLLNANYMRLRLMK